MNREQKIEWMTVWCAKNDLKLVLEGECGFGRECVGISAEEKYPDYMWDDKDYNRIDKNGEVWTPPNAYHKYPCVAVLGRGEEAEAELFDWLQWFDANNFKLETGDQDYDQRLGAIAILMGKHRYARMVRQS